MWCSSSPDAPPKIRVVGDLGLRQFDLRDKSGAELASWSALTVSRLELEPIARQAYIGDVGLWAPQVHARRYENLRLNWQDVAEQLQQLGAKPGAAKPAGGKPVAGKPADAKTQDAKAAPNAGKAAAQPADPQASAKVSAAQAGAPEAGKAASAAAAAKPAGAKPADAKAGDAKAADAKSADAKAAEAKAAEPKFAIPAAGGAAAGAATPSASAAAGAAPPDGPAGTAPAPQPAEPAEWKITLDAFNIHEGELHLTDAVSKLDYSMTGIAATVEGVEIPQQKDRPINLWLTVDNSTDGGWIRAKGPLVLQPLALEMSFRMGNVALAPFAPAVRSAAPITLQDGRVALSAQVHVLDKGGAVDVSATGAQAELTQFKARDESLKPALDVALQRLHLTADRLAMGPGQSNFTLDADGVQGNGKLALKGRSRRSR